MLKQSDPEVAKFLLRQAQKAVHQRWQNYKQMAAMKPVDLVETRLP